MTTEADTARATGRLHAYNTLCERMRVEGWVTISEASRDADIPAPTIYSWVRAKKIDQERVGRKYLFVNLAEVMSLSVTAALDAIRARG